jgi:hypothetical protein
MQRRKTTTVMEVCAIVCDRCRKEAHRDGDDYSFQQMTSIAFDAGYDSIFGDGSRVEIDLCAPCLKETVGAWLRVIAPEDTERAHV